MKKFYLFALVLLMAVGAQAKDWQLEDLKDGKTYTFGNGDVVTGTLQVNATLHIAKGATIILRNAKIIFRTSPKYMNDSHSGLHANGDATILLEGKNRVEAYGSAAPGIFVEKGYTLGIDEVSGKTGSLEAYSARGAGIGAGYKYYKKYLASHHSCGNIIIGGGTIHAYSGIMTGIGGGYETSCGYITIGGGNIKAEGSHGAGIGSGVHNRTSGSDYWSECGKITINGGEVYASSIYAAGIGCGQNGRCSEVVINNGVDSLYVKGGIGKGIHNTYAYLPNGLTLFGTYYPDGITTSPYIYPVPTTPEPEPEPVCDPVTNVQVSDITHYSVKVTWDANDATDYTVFIRESSSNEVYYVMHIASNTVILDELKANTDYYVQIYQNCANGVSSSDFSTTTFTTAQKPEPVATDEVYTVFEDGVLKYYYDSRKSSRTGIVEVYDPSSTNNRFTEYYDQVETAIIDPSMYGANLTSFANMFYGGSGPRGASYPLKNMTKIYGLENLNWYEVNSIAGMFLGCKSLTYLNLNSFNTFSVTNMSNAFNGCSGLNELNISMWDFMSVTNMSGMFNECKSLQTIYCNYDLGAVTTASEAFYNCLALVGGQGTTYDAVSSTYARPDGGASNPGYFTEYTCPQPTDLSVGDVTGTSATLFWLGDDEYTYGWLVRYKKEGDSGYGKSIMAYTTYVMLTDLDPNSTYTVSVTSECAPSMESYSSSFSFTTGHGEGIEDVRRTDVQSTKVLREGQLMIKVGEKMYNATGVEVR